MTEWAAFTRMALKAATYEREPWFREGLSDAAEILGDGVAEIIRNSALVLIKPDGLVSGRLPRIAAYLRGKGFSITAASTVELTRFHWREMWRYQLTSATLDRLAVNDLVLSGSAVLLLLRHEGALDVPASVWLSGQKGPSDIASQRPDCLRRFLEQPNRIFSFIHVADEPADVVRELAILLDQPGRRRALAATAAGRIEPGDQAVLDAVMAAFDGPRHSLSATEAVERVEAAVRGAASANGFSARALDDLARMRRGERIAWRPFAEAIARVGAPLDRWDFAALGAAFIEYDEPGTSKLIKGVDANLWRTSVQPS